MTGKRQRPTSALPNSKRRRGEADPAATADPAAQQAAVKAYIFHAVKLLQKAVKKSRTFELQKLVRKVKTAREPKEGVPAPDAALLPSLEAQLAALKLLPLDPLPPYLLTTRLPKLAYLRPILPSILESIPPATNPELVVSSDSTSAEGKARNRVLANRVVKDAWDEVVRAVAKRMGHEVEERVVKEGKVTGAVKGKATLVGGGEGQAVGKADVGKEAVESGLEEGKTADSSTPVGEGEGEKGADEVTNAPPPKRLSKRAERAAKGAAKALLPKPGMDPGRKAALEAARIAKDVDGSDADVEEDGDASEADDDDEVMRELARLGSGSESGSDNDGGFDSGDDDDDEGLSDDSLPAQPAKKARREQAPAKHKPPTSSAFLPSLASGYISYSDSDGEDAQWVKDSEKDDKKERKNRRGQRARRAIWEQKYGSGANHIVKEVGGAPAPTKGGKASKPTTKKARREAAPPAPVATVVAPFDPATAKTRGGVNANAQPVLERKASRVEPGMHPSWEAKRKAAEALQNIAAAPKGKKITFD